MFTFHYLNLTIEEQDQREWEKRRNQSTTDVKDLNSRKDGKIFFADIIHNEMRRLQKSVDKLFQGGNQIKTDDANVKSLIQVLSGKEGNRNSLGGGRSHQSCMSSREYRHH